jgi:hypothetical protein
VRGVSRRGQQLVDESFAFVGPFIGEKRSHVRRSRYDTRKIEASAPQELSVARWLRWFDFRIRPLSAQQFVDTTRHLGARPFRWRFVCCGTRGRGNGAERRLAKSEADHQSKKSIPRTANSHDRALLASVHTDVPKADVATRSIRSDRCHYFSEFPLFVHRTQAEWRISAAFAAIFVFGNRTPANKKGMRPLPHPFSYFHANCPD